jgi:hypothetical protein
MKQPPTRKRRRNSISVNRRTEPNKTMQPTAGRSDEQI